jgi:hypothetical protein
MSQPNTPEEDDLLLEYDFSNAVRGRHHESYREGTNVVFLDPDLAKAFKDSAHVNRVLRMLLAKESPDEKEPVR